MSTVTYAVAGTLTLPPDHTAGASPGADTAETAGVCPDRETAEVRALLDRARAGDQAAFGRLIDMHQRVVYRTALAALGRREDAEDAAQEAFIQAWRHLPGFRGAASFRTWLLTIAWRKALDRRRTRLLWWKRSATAAAECDPFEDVAGTDPTPERETLARDALVHLRREIARLSPTLRDTLLLAASGEYTYEEIAAILKTPLGTIKWRVAEARRVVSSRVNR